MTVADAGYYGSSAAGLILAQAAFHNFEREEKQRVLDLGIGRAPADLPVEGAC